MSKGASFQEGLRRDVTKRLRSAIDKIMTRTIDLEIDARRAGDVNGNLKEIIALESHIQTLRWAICRVTVDGDIHLGRREQEALAAAEARRPKPAPAPQKSASPRAGAPPRYVVDLTCAQEEARASSPRRRRLPAAPRPLLPPAQESLFRAGPRALPPGVIEGKLEEDDHG